MEMVMVVVVEGKKGIPIVFVAFGEQRLTIHPSISHE
jgi:hypothetical protein